MSSFEKNTLLIGDWIRGKLKSGELIHGYIEAIEPTNGVIKVKVVQSDNSHLIGRTIGLLNKWVEKTAVTKAIHNEQLLQLIDVALAAGDKEWFMELTSQLKSDNVPAIQTDKKMNAAYSEGYLFNKRDSRG